MLQTQSMSEVMVLSATHSRRQLETIAQQSREIASAAQKLATETTRPLGFGIHQPDGDGHRPCAHPVVCFVALFCPSVNADEHGVDDRRDGPVSANSLSRLCGYPLPAQPKLRDDRLRRHPPPVLGQSPPQSHIKGQVTSTARSGGVLF